MQLCVFLLEGEFTVRMNNLIGRFKNSLNYYCILFEGIFNILGTDILGMSTIIPLFLADFGAGTGLIGSLTTTNSIIGAIMPLIAGSFIATTASKRKVSLLFNGVSRGLLLVIPVILLMGLSNSMVIVIFFAVMLVYFICQPVAGISWNYLLGDCVEAQKRGNLMGTLFAISGFITFASSNIIRLIRGSGGIDQSQKYALIFALAGVFLTISVLCFVPLKEKSIDNVKKEELSAKAYIPALLICFKNKDFVRLLFANGFSQVSTLVNAFIYVYAQNTLKLSVGQISNLLVIQTVGLVIGGLTTGRVSSRFGTKRLLILIESIGLAIPLLELASSRVSPFVVIAIAVFLLGFSKSGYMGYQIHLLEVAPPDKIIYHIVSKSLALLPISFVSVGVGLYMEHFAVKNIFIAQICICLIAIFCASRLKSIVYKNQD